VDTGSVDYSIWLLTILIFPCRAKKLLQRNADAQSSTIFMYAQILAIVELSRKNHIAAFKPVMAASSGTEEEAARPCNQASCWSAYFLPPSRQSRGYFRQLKFLFVCGATVYS
jgi:hypothetical protein